MKSRGNCLVESDWLRRSGSIVLESCKITRNAVGTEFIADKPVTDAPSHDAYRVEHKRLAAIGALSRQNLARGCGHGLLQKGRRRNGYLSKTRLFSPMTLPTFKPKEIASACPVVVSTCGVTRHPDSSSRAGSFDQVRSPVYSPYQILRIAGAWQRHVLRIAAIGEVLRIGGVDTR
jgi:hypothetical protein